MGDFFNIADFVLMCHKVQAGLEQMPWVLHTFGYTIIAVDVAMLLIPAFHKV